MGIEKKTPAPADDGAIDPNDNNQVGAGGANDDTPDLEEQAMAAFNEGVDGIEPAPKGEPAPKTPAEPKDGDPAPKEGEEGDDAEEGGEPEPDAAVEQEIGKFGIKNEAAKARFRELTAAAKERDELRTQLMEVTGDTEGKDLIGRVKLLYEQAVQSYELIESIKESTATPEQFGAVMGYVKLVNTKDPVKMRLAYQAMSKEQAWLAKELGEEVAGVYDPLDEHEDLKLKVSTGKLDREDALETARLRNATRLAGTRVAEVETQGKQSVEAEKAQKAGFDAVVTLCGQLVKDDPEGYKAKQPLLSPLVKDIQAKYPPDQWAVQTELAYRRLAKPAPAAKPPRTPVKGRTSPAVGSRVPMDDFDALSMGIDSVTR